MKAWAEHANRLHTYVYYGLGWLKPALGDAAIWVVGALLAVVYLGVFQIGLAYEWPDPRELMQADRGRGDGHRLPRGAVDLPGSRHVVIDLLVRGVHPAAHARHQRVL